ncbi:hypothetical protein [Halobacteriovorax sp. JY17]|uniref:hypothetical protein n=1 Tax=Halobacteriovorax sp. JY17 TaxID=2014617 RepID=UPI000C577F15|nr:hypothetical protein [Halobacteriovorax sp. JY17]PIK16075.1 MAG: hypothetical protein CES88_04915 [Halobacteriovorax sp. JY17]
MKKSLLVLLSLLCLNSTYAISDSDCRDIYNESFENLVSASIDFNQGYSDKFEFSAQVAEISTRVSAIRAICLAVESPDNKKCVATYKKRYKTLRNQIKLTSVLVGNQTEVKPRVIQSITNEFSSLINRVKCGDL